MARKRFEYLKKSVAIDKKEMDELGAGGWELVLVLPETHLEPPKLIFKKEV